MRRFPCPALHAPVPLSSFACADSPVQLCMRRFPCPALHALVPLSSFACGYGPTDRARSQGKLWSGCQPVSVLKQGPTAEPILANYEVTRTMAEPDGAHAGSGGA
eukprot:353714-Chlamydomonas_euryale.AAC.2